MKKDGTKLCKHCKSEMPADAKVCPNCRKKQGMKAWQIILIVIAAIAIIGGIAGSGSDEPTSNGSEGSKNPSVTQKSEEKKEFSQGETVSYKNVNFTVTDVKRSQGSKYSSLKSGYEYVIVSVKIENNSKEKISYNPFDWKMENSNGQELDHIYTSVNEATELNSGDLNPGGVAEGTIAFEQPKGDSGLKLNYYENMLNEYASFKIKLN